MAITTVHNELIAVNAISGTAIADNAVTSVHIAKNNVGTVQIAQNSVTSVSIALNQVTGTQIANNAITSTQLADNAVTATKIPDGTQLELGATNFSGEIHVGGTSVAAGTASLMSDGHIKAVLSSGGSGDTLIGAISGVSNGHQIIVDSSNNQTYKWFNGSTNSMIIDSSGKVGIGTSPSVPLHVKGATASSGKFLLESGTLTNNNQAALFMAATNVNGNTGNVSIECIHPNNQQSDLVIRTGATDATSYGTERMRIDTAGKVGINDTTPAALFTVKGSADSYAGGLRLEGYNETTALGIAHVDGDNFISGNATNDHITLKANGSVGIGATNNDLRASLTGSVLPNKTLQVGYGQISSDHTSYNYNTNFTNNAYQSGNNATFSAMTSRGAGVIQLLENMFIFTSASGGTAGQQLSLTERMRINSSGNLGIGTSTVPINGSGGTQPLYLTMHKDAGNLIELSADHSASGELIGGIDFTNDNNADAANNDADGKLVALMRARTYTDDSNASDDSGGVLQFATKDDGGVLAERLKINETGEIQIKGQYNSSGNSQFAFKTVYYQFDMDSGGTHYLQVPLYSSYSSSNSSGWAEMDIAWFPDHASHTHLHSYKFMWGSNHSRILNLGVISATANETDSSYGPYNITSKSQLFRHPTAGENNMTYLYIKMQGYHSVNKRRVITLRGVASADANTASIGPVIDHGSTEPVANMVSVNAEIESA